MLHEANQPPTIVLAAAPPKRKVIRKTRPPTPPTSDSDADSESSSGYSSYDEPATIYKKVVDDAQCEFVSPSGLAAHTTTKDMIKHLQSKSCPELPNLKKNVTANKMESPKAPKPRKVKAVPIVVEPVAAAPKVVKKVKAPEPVAAVLAAPAPAKAEKAAKTKRPASDYAKHVGAVMKAGGSMKDAAASWKLKKEQS